MGGFDVLNVLSKFILVFWDIYVISANERIKSRGSICVMIVTNKIIVDIFVSGSVIRLRISSQK